WRGPPLADLQDNGWAGDDVRRLDELRLSLLEEEFGCRLELRSSQGLIDDLESACAAAPLRERLHAQLMLALDGAGRRADALHEYDRVRRRLSEDLGIEPGAVLREAHMAVMAEPAVTRAPIVRVTRRAARRGRRITLLACLVVGVVGTAAVMV